MTEKEELWEQVVEYCDNDVITTEEVWLDTQPQFKDEVLLFLTWVVWFLYFMYVLNYAIRWFYEDFKRRKDKKKRMDTNLKEKAKKISNFVYNNYGEILAGAFVGSILLYSLGYFIRSVKV